MSESELLKTERIYSPSRTQNFKTTTNLDPSPTPPHKKLATLKSCIFIRFGRITFKLGNFLNVKTLFRRCRRFRPNDPHIENLKFRSGTLPWYWLWCCLKRLYNLSKGYCEVLYCGSVYFCCQHCF